MLLSTARVRGLAKALSDGLAPCGRLGRSMSRSRRCGTWRWRWPWAGTAWPTSRWSGPSLTCLVRWPRTRLSVVSSRPWLKNRLRRSQRSVPPRAHARNRVWWHRTAFGDDADARQVIVDLDATLIGARSGNGARAPNFKGGFGVPPDAHLPILTAHDSLRPKRRDPQATNSAAAVQFGSAPSIVEARGHMSSHTRLPTAASDACRNALDERKCDVFSAASTATELHRAPPQRRQIRGRCGCSATGPERVAQLTPNLTVSYPWSPSFLAQEVQVLERVGGGAGGRG